MAKASAGTRRVIEFVQFDAGGVRYELSMLLDPRTVLLVALLGSCATPKTTATNTRSTVVQPLTIDLVRHPDLQFRVDSFFVPDAARAEFEAAMRRNLSFLEKLPGFRGHLVLEKSGGPTSFNVVTIAVWDNPQAIEAAGKDVRAYYQKIGFDLPAQLAKWGVRAELGNFQAFRGAP
ncbi:MAG TPA: antibiotic biosynthesis monooxygenase family protein [Haliangiales bacterium]|nr:antibiotic biosynthesis monooxygenase family protein [Haliangiales bacterium]